MLRAARVRMWCAMETLPSLNWMRMIDHQQCQDSFVCSKVPPGSVTAHREAAGAAASTATLLAAERVVTVVCEH